MHDIFDFLSSKLKINPNNRNWYIPRGDVIFTIMSTVGAYIYRLEVLDGAGEYYSSLPWLLILSLIIKPIIFTIFKMYRTKWENASICDFVILFLAISGSSALMAVFTLIVFTDSVFSSLPRSIVIIDWILSVFFIGGLRIGPKAFYKWSKELKNKRGLVKDKLGSEDNFLIKNIDKLLIIIVFLYNMAYLLFGEVISVHDGFGWDGRVYRNITKSFGSAILFSKKLDAYSIQRIFPSAIVHFGLKLFQFPLMDEYVLLGFKILNILLLLVSAWTFIRIANELNFSISGKLLCFIGLFVNFASSKQFFYYPVLTDQMAFTLGLLMLYYFLKKNRAGLITTTLIGSFTWPLLIYYGIILYIFPRKDSSALHKNKKFSYVILITSMLLLLAAYIWIYIIRNSQMPDSSKQINYDYVLISILCSMIYVFLGIKSLVNAIGIPKTQDLKKSISIPRIISGLVTLILLKIFISSLAADQETSLSTISFIERVLISSIVMPFNFYIAHVVYFGPIIYLVTFLWKPLTRIVGRYGVGMFLFISVNFILSLFSESRALIPAFSFFVILTISAMEEYRWPKWFYWGFGIIAFIFSKIWLPLGSIQMGGGYFEFPYQWYFMNYGPWMSDQMYAVQGFFILVSGIIFFIIIKEIIHLQNR